MSKPSQPSTFCSVPWTQLATNASGYYRVCCNALPEMNLIRDEDGKPMMVYRNSVEEAWASPTYTKLRKQLLSSERPEMCLRCFREEDSGVESARQRWNRRWPLNSEVNPEDPRVRYIDLRLGNLCNLKCRMCNPYASNKWVDEWNQVVKEAHLVPKNALSDEEIKRLKKMDWPELSDTWENLYGIIDSIEEIYLTGGEPFLSMEQVRLLNRIVESGKSKNIILKYNTNLTLLPRKLLDIWDNFKAVKINTSIDGIGPLLSYIRNPADWSTVEEHLNQLIKLKNSGTNLELGIHVTVQMYNILVLHQIVGEFKNRFNLNPYLNILNHPHCLNIRTLPLHLKKKVLTNFGESKDLQPIAKYMMSENWYEKYFQEFISYTTKLDLLRSQNLSDFFPEFLIGDFVERQTSSISK